MPLPTWVDFQGAEKSAATMLRNLSGAPAAWETLLAISQAVLGSRTDNLDSMLPDTYDFDEWKDLIAAARVLDNAATDKGLDEVEDRQTAAILAACAFGMSGTGISAQAVIHERNVLDGELSQGELVALALSSPTLIRAIYPRLTSGSVYHRCVEHLLAYLATGEPREFDSASTALIETIRQERNPWEGNLLRLSRLSLAHVGRLSVANVLNRYRDRFPAQYVDKLVAASPVFLPSQYEALKEPGILSHDRNLLITLPPGTGKTLLGEISLINSLKGQPGLVCYLAPYVALGNQVYDRISGHMPDNVIVRRLLGGYKETNPLDPQNNLEILVVTPERFDAMLRLRSELLPQIRCVVVDEAHMIGNHQRGLRLEGILTRMRLAAQRGRAVPRFVLLSAVVENSDALADWLDIGPGDVIRGTWRPTAPRLSRWTEDGKIRLHVGDDAMRDESSEVLGETSLPWPHARFSPPPNYGAFLRQQESAMDNVAYLAELQYSQYGQPVLCVCASRPKTRRLAAQVAARFTAVEPTPTSVREVIDLIDNKYAYLLPLKETLQKGVAYHNSSLPHDVRSGIERAVDSRDIKVLSSTTTLAEGVDLPFRVTILADWLFYDGRKDTPMESLLFRNIAGRCGRAGRFTEGDTVVFDNPVGDPEYTALARRRDHLDEILFPGEAPHLASAISQMDRASATAHLGTHLLAAIRENPSEEDLASAFLNFSFAIHTDDASTARTLIASAFNDILDESKGPPLAVATSPARLTEFGEAANNSGLSPGTARLLRTTLGRMSDYGGSREDLVNVGVILLTALSGAEEQQNRDLRYAIQSPKRTQNAVRERDLHFALDRWIAGEPMDRIYGELPSNQTSKRKPNLQIWLGGYSADSTWNGQFEKFCDFIDGAIEYFLPWILRSADNLSKAIGQTGQPWLDWARFVELGVDNQLGAELIDNDIVADRSLARVIGARLGELADGTPLTIEDVEKVLNELPANDRPTSDRILRWFRRRFFELQT